MLYHTLLATFAITGSLTSSPIQSSTSPSVAPRTVALMPVINLTGEKWKELREGLESRLTSKLAEVFAERGFSVADPIKVNAALDETKIDILDEENHRKDTLYKVGDAVGTQYVAFVVLTHNTQRTKTNFLTSTPEGEVTIKYWLVTIDPKAAIFSAKSETAKARPHSWLGVAKGSDQQLTAADRVVPAAFKDFLTKYPLIKKDKPVEKKGGGTPNQAAY